MKRKKITVNGKEQLALVVPFHIDEEHWNRYKLKDGTILRAKHSAVEIMRVDDLRTDSGEPVYFISWQPCTVAEEVPEILMSDKKSAEKLKDDGLDGLKW